LQHIENRISDEVMAAYNRRILANFEFKYAEEIWEFLKPQMTDSFQNHVDKLRSA